MNNEQIKSLSEEILNRLHPIDYDKFAKFNVRTGFPEYLSDDFLKLQNDFAQLIKQLPSSSFPIPDIEKLFRKGMEAVNPRKSIVSPDDLTSGKETLTYALNMIVENAKMPIEIVAQLEPTAKKSAVKRTAKIFVSHYEQQTLEDILSVFEMLEELTLDVDLDLDEVEPIARSQLNGIGEIVDRIEMIKSCTGAIICFPDSDLETPENIFIKFDLGACMASFPDNVILLHKNAGDKLPEALLDKVKPFQFIGGLDLRTGMQLAKVIIKILG